MSTGSGDPLLYKNGVSQVTRATVLSNLLNLFDIDQITPSLCTIRKERH